MQKKSKQGDSLEENGNVLKHLLVRQFTVRPSGSGRETVSPAGQRQKTIDFFWRIERAGERT
jgi:hypothetical protein